MTEQLRPQESQLSAEQVLQASSEFLQHFRVEVSPTEQPEQFLEAMAQLDPRFQGGRELVRWQLEADQTEWPEDTKDVIMRTAESFRMLEAETPLVGDYDAVIALGGARQSNLDRLRYAADAIKSGKATAKHLVAAGSSRQLIEAEQENTANYAPGAKTEFDLIVGAAKTVAQENPGIAVSVVYIDEEKAGTPKVLETTLSALQASGAIRRGSKVAAVTTQIYQESTELDLARVARPFGITETFTAGNPSDPKVVAARKPATYLTEDLRTIKAAVNAKKAESQEKTEYADAVRNPEDEEVHNNGDYTVYRDSQSGKEYIVVNEAQEVEEEPQFVKAARAAGSTSVSHADEEVESNDRDESGISDYRQYPESGDIEVGRDGHAIIYQDAKTGENYIVGVDHTGRGYSETSGLFYENWSDPGMHPE